MTALRSKLVGRLNRGLRLTRVRLFSQVLFFVLFLLAVWATWTSRLGGYPVSGLLELDPLVMVSTVLATGYVYKALGWGLIIVAVTFLFGRVFCIAFGLFGLGVLGFSRDDRRSEHRRTLVLEPGCFFGVDIVVRRKTRLGHVELTE